MDVEKRIDLVKKLPTEEIINERELRELLEVKDRPEHYIGFEISGFLHIGTILMCGEKVNDLIKAGFNCKIFLADYHSFLNNKLGGNWENIRKAVKYYEEAFKFYCPKAKIVLGSELYHNNDEYWRDVIRFSKKLTLQRNLRALTIMGRSEKDKIDFGQLLYPPMQGVDVKYLGEDLSHGGMDQRKIHVLCREIFPKLGWKKPVILHHHLLSGLEKYNEKGDKIERVIEAKMSKSKPWTAIFIHDNYEEIREKLKKAWCPFKEIEGNPVLEIVKYIIFRKKDRFVVERDNKFGGDVEFYSYDELEREYVNGKIHPMDLKENVARDLNEIIRPLREYFDKRRELLEVFNEEK